MTISAKTFFKFALVGVAAASLVACADKPKPVEPTAPPMVHETPKQEPIKEQPLPPKPEPTGPVPGSMQDFVVNVGDRVYFDTDQSSLRSDGLAVLDSQASWLVRYTNVKVRIEGNADERGTREYNFALGAKRAEAIASYLVSKGVVPGRIATISYGKENPIDTGTGEEAWAKNRNGHTSITSGAK